MSPSAQALKLARRLVALPETMMRQRVLAEFLQATDLRQVVTVFDEFYRWGRQGGPPFNIALLTMVMVISSEELDYELKSNLYTIAKETGLTDFARLFYSESSSQTPQPSLRAENLELTLGHRKSLAHGHNRAVLERLLRHPEPEIMPHLLENSLITEADVIRLAAQRPGRSDVLKCIFYSKKWVVRYGVQRALVLNPTTPTDLSLKLLGFFNRQDLRLIRTTSILPPVIREAAKRLGG
jgi:hypothetical protein